MIEQSIEQTKEKLIAKLRGLEQMPSLPVSLVPLLRYMEQPLEKLEVQEVVELISQDKSLVAQSLYMANSPLFGRWQRVESIRDAVVSLGLQRMRDIVMSCSVLTLVPKEKTGVDPVVFWEHSLGCALVCRQFARRIQFEDPAKAYLSGLLHDIGVVAHLWIVPNEFGRAFAVASKEGIPLHEAEQHMLGITHAETGKAVAERWNLSADLVNAIAYHHHAEESPSHRALVGLVSLADMLCRMGGLGHGTVEKREVNFLELTGFRLLKEECPSLNNFDWARFTFELETYLEEVHRLVSVLYRPQ